MFKSFDRGDLPNYPDPDEPTDLGDPLTQDEIDWVKKLRKEMTERFDPPVPTCTTEKISPSITDTTATSFTLTWTNPVGSTATMIQYRVTGDVDWETFNAVGSATGYYSGMPYDTWIVTSGFTVGISYDIVIRNQCPNGIMSPGVISTAIAT